jgi:hypothetical protein
MVANPSPAPFRTPTAGIGARKPNGWPASLVLGIAVALVYLANGREIGAFDTVPTTLLPLSIVRGDGLRLDRFRPLFLRVWGTPRPVFVTESAGHLISSYPVGPALVALPLVASQVVVMDSARPTWDRDPIRAFEDNRRMGKCAAAVLSALVAVALHRLLLGMGLSRVASPTVLATSLGSTLWSVASQALWQHGPAALFLTLTMLLLRLPPISRRRLMTGGLTTALLVVVRAIDVIFALVVLAWVARVYWRQLPWFLAAPVVLGLVLVGSNLYYFGSLAGGQDQIERQHSRLHGVGGPWSGNVTEGMAGTLLSPSRGLFVFSPWIALAVATAPVAVKKIAKGSLAKWLVLALVPYLYLLSKYAVWWAGGSFGPRYWTDALPLFGVMLACALDWAWGRSRLLVALLAVTILMSVAIHAIGAFCYPSTWNFYPTDIDLDHARLWDWRDTELSRSLKESLSGMVPMRVPGR